MSKRGATNASSLKNYKGNEEPEEKCNGFDKKRLF